MSGFYSDKERKECEQVRVMMMCPSRATSSVFCKCMTFVPDIDIFFDTIYFAVEAEVNLKAIGIVVDHDKDHLGARGGGGGHSPYDLLRTRVQKKRRKGSVFRYTASKGVVDVSPLYRHLGVLFRKVGFEGFWTPFDI